MDMDVNVNGARVKSQEYPRFTKEQGPQRSAGRATPPPTTRGGSEWYCGGGFRTAKAVEPRTVASTLPPLSVAPWFPDSADRQKMRVATVCIVFVLTCTSESFVTGIRYIDPMSPQPGSNGDIGNKRVDITEPSCDELRAMWRNIKRPNRATRNNNGYPIYQGPFYNMWNTYPDRTKSSMGYRGAYATGARSRAAGGAPIYGKMVHKAPAGSRFRNGMRQRTRAFEDMTRLYGTVNRFTPSSRRHVSRFRVGGGISPSKSQVPQAGSFEALKNLIQAERARELQERHIAEEMEAESGSLKEDEESKQSLQNPRKHFFNPLQIPPHINYEYNQRREHVPNIGQAWSRSGPITREYLSQEYQMR